MTTPPPSPEIARAFGQPHATPILIDAGQRQTFRLGNLALKYCEAPALTEWQSAILESLPQKNFRLARPVRAHSGNFVVDNWSATQWIDGTTSLDGHWLDVIEACNALPLQLKNIPASPLLQQIDNPFTRADAAAWYSPPADSHPEPVIQRLLPLLRPVTLPAQLIFGDPSEGNFLFTPNQPPAIIDLAFYWHPPQYTIALFIADAIAWSRAPLSLLDHVAAWPEMPQLLLRAILFRLHVHHLFQGSLRPADPLPYAPILHAIEHWPR